MTRSLPQTIGLLLTKQLELFSDHKAIGWIENQEIKSLTFKEYKGLIQTLTSSLIKHGLKVGDKVAILSQTCKEWHFLDMATLCGRGCTVPIYPSYLSSEVIYIIKHSESSILVIENDKQAEKIIPHLGELPDVKLIIALQELPEDTLKKFRNQVQYITYKQLTSDGIEEVKNHPDLFENTLRSQDPNELASIIYTSGTTGEPKGAMITHAAIITMLANVAKSTQGAFHAGDRTLTFLPLSHVLGRCDSFLPLIFGWHSVYAESLEKVLDNIKLVQPTVMIAVPRIFEKIYHHIQERINDEGAAKKKVFDWALSVGKKYYEKVDHDRSPSFAEMIEYQLAYKLVFKKINSLFGGKIRYFISGGAPLSQDIMAFLKFCGLTVLEGYGLTETIAPCCLNPTSKQVAGSVGKPVGDVQFKFAEDGEILIKTKALFTGYYKNEKATEESFENGWFKSGDIGQFNTEGYLVITDRKKDIIVTSGGKNIAPQKIENLSKSSSYISHLIVVGDKQKFLVALVGIEKERFIGRLEELGLPSSATIVDIARNAKTRELITQDIETINQQLSSHETIKKFHILEEELNIQNFLTPSLKIKRKKLVEHYQKEIDAMYK